MINPLVSVIIPNYNHELFLEKRIESVLDQTFQDFEIIILDDYSKDSSGSIIKKYENHPKVSHVILNTINSGSTFKQWMKGISLASGKYIWIAESDDYNSPLFLETLILKMESNDNIGLCYSNSCIVNENNKRTTFLGFEKFPNSIIDPTFSSSFEMNGKSFIERLMFRQNAIPNASAVVFKRTDSLMNYLGQCSTMKLFGDWYFWVLVILNSDIYFCANELNFFRNHPKTVRNTTAKLKSTLFEQLKVYVLLARIFPRENNKLLDFAIFKYLDLKKSTIFSLTEKFTVHKMLFVLNKMYFTRYIKSTLR